MKGAFFFCLLGILVPVVAYNCPSPQQQSPARGMLDRGPTIVPAAQQASAQSTGTVDTFRQTPLSTPTTISIDAVSLLAAYASDEPSARARYEDKRLVVTGVLTGVFIPTTATTMRMAEKGLAAHAFVTMGGPRPNSAEETLFLPGIKAYSGASSFFGQRDTGAIADKLRIGETVTLVCTCGRAFRAENGTNGYSVDLDDCILQASPTGRLPVPPSNDTGGVFHIGQGVSPPRAILAPDPEYSEEARKANLQGTCVLWLVVGSDGRPRDIRVTRTLGLGLDEKAIEAVKQWKFEPAMKDGRPVAVTINVEVTFHTWRNLRSTIGDLGVQSGLIARDHGDLTTLREKGDRSYYEFTLVEGEQPQKISAVMLQLKHTDPKRGKFTLKVIADNKNTEKKDRTVGEPVQFYVGGMLYELVVWTVEKDRAAGYLSSPRSQ